MKIHPRDKVTTEARHELEGTMLALIAKYDLTYGEVFEMLGEQLSRTAKYAVRSERQEEKEESGEPRCRSCHRNITDSPAGGCKTPKEHG